MATKTYWIDEPTILAADYDGHVGEVELNQVMDVCTAIVDKHPCYFLVDVLKMTSLQPSVFKLGNMLRFLSNPNMRWIVFLVGHNPIMKFGIQVTVRNKASVFRDRDEALTFLRNRVKLDKEAEEVASRLSA